MEEIAAYHQTGLAMGIAGGLLFLQLLVTDLAGWRAGHTPGAPVPANHDHFIFRATRSTANMNESVAIFILFTLIGILSKSDPLWLGRMATLYVTMRGAYMLCYWFNIKLARSVFFGISLLALLGLGIVMVGGLVH